MYVEHFRLCGICHVLQLWHRHCPCRSSPRRPCGGMPAALTMAAGGALPWWAARRAASASSLGVRTLPT